MDAIQTSLLSILLLLPRVPKTKIQEKFQTSFCKILKNKWCHVKVLPNRFYLNGHTIRFCPQINAKDLLNFCDLLPFEY